jgi:hypothetical protein
VIQDFQARARGPARLAIGVRQEGDNHRVTGRLRHEGADLETWFGGELEDRVTSVELSSPGAYLLMIQTTFFGPAETVDIRLQLLDAGGGRFDKAVPFRGSAGDSHTVVVAILVE